MFSLTRCRGVGIFKAEGLDAEVELITPAIKAISRYVKAPATLMLVVPSMLSSGLFPAGKGLSLLLRSLKGFPGL
jgi:hypothetical protein